MQHEPSMEPEPEPVELALSVEPKLRDDEAGSSGSTDAVPEEVEQGSNLMSSGLTLDAGRDGSTPETTEAGEDHNISLVPEVQQRPSSGRMSPDWHGRGTSTRTIGISEARHFVSQDMSASATAGNKAGHRLDHPVDGDGNPYIEHLLWTFACILKPVPAKQMQRWLHSGLMRGSKVGTLAHESWRRLARDHLRGRYANDPKVAPNEVESLLNDHNLTAMEIDEIAQSDLYEAPFEDFVVEMAQKFRRAGLQMQLVQRSKTSQHKVVILLRCPEAKFMDEYRRLLIRRWKATGQGLEFTRAEQQDSRHALDLLIDPTEADRIHMIAALLQREEERGGCGLGNLEHLQEDLDTDPRIDAVFPLHNVEWVESVKAEWKKDGCCSRLSGVLKRACDCRRSVARAVKAEAMAKRMEHFAARAQAASVTTAKALYEVSPTRVVEAASSASKRIQQGAIDGAMRTASGAKAAVSVTVQTAGTLVNKSTGLLGTGNKEPGSPNSPADNHMEMLGSHVNAILEHAETVFVSSHAAAKYVKNILAPDAMQVSQKTLGQLRGQYGVRFAFLFAFMQTVSTTLTVLWVILMTGGFVLRFVDKDWYLRILGIAGLLIPCVWCPIFLGTWDRLSGQLSRQWNQIGVTELPIPNPFYRKGRESKARKRCKTLYLLLVFVVIVGAIGVMIVVNFFLMEFELLLQTTPLCNSFVYNTVWADNLAWDGVNAPDFPFNLLSFPGCYVGPSTNPLDVDVSGGALGGSWMWRGLMMLGSGIVIGILIDVVYTEIFTCFAHWLASQKNKLTWQDHERMVINYTYPFEAASFSLYFWILALIFIPFGSDIQMYLLRQPHWNETSIDMYEYRNGSQNFISPHRLHNDSVCDEWRGTCTAGSDVFDCATVGCTDPAAMNYSPHFNVSVAPTKFPIYSLDGRSLPDGLMCTYSIQSDGLDTLTLCPSATTDGTGSCDEPLHCLLAVLTTDPVIAPAIFAECEEDLNAVHTCPFGSDTADCRDLTRQILRQCGEASGTETGCMAVLKQRFAEGSESTPRDACHVLKPLDSNVTCAAFGLEWPAESPRLSAELRQSLVDHSKALQCSTPSAVQCVELCDPCVACIPTDEWSDDDIAAAGASLSFCAEYDLCPSCAVACAPFAHCFAPSVQERSRGIRDAQGRWSSTATACQRIGWSRNNWCDAQRANASLNCMEIRADQSWYCDLEDDWDDCSQTCNFGCDDPQDVNYGGPVRQNYPSACSGQKLRTVEHMVRVWLHDKRFINEIDMAISVPLVIAHSIVMLIEFVLPMLCTTWWKTNRKQDIAYGHARVAKTMACGRRCFCICRRCKCCIASMNCFMCDEDAMSKAQLGRPAVAISDSALAARMSSSASSGNVEVRTKAWSSKHQGHYYAADDLILESMLEPIVLTTEYRKLCILIWSVSMWSIVFPWVPLR